MKYSIDYVGKDGCEYSQTVDCDFKTAWYLQATLPKEVRFSPVLLSIPDWVYRLGVGEFLAFIARTYNYIVGQKHAHYYAAGEVVSLDSFRKKGGV